AVVRPRRDHAHPVGPARRGRAPRGRVPGYGGAARSAAPRIRGVRAVSAPIASRIGAQLYAGLPEIYRTRDKDGDLARYLDACGGLLDGVYASLRQRLDDNFPDSCQEWLIPYFADLVDVMPRSPEPSGRRREVASGIAWRQRKGTAACTEDLAEAVADAEVELQEGWQ